MTIRCDVCEGSGEEEWWTMGPADNMDIDGGFDTCSNCGGHGWVNIIVEFTEDEVAA